MYVPKKLRLLKDQKLKAEIAEILRTSPTRCRAYVEHLQGKCGFSMSMFLSLVDEWGLEFNSDPRRVKRNTTVKPSREPNLVSMLTRGTGHVPITNAEALQLFHNDLNVLRSAHHKVHSNCQQIVSE